MSNLSAFLMGKLKTRVMEPAPFVLLLVVLLLLQLLVKQCCFNRQGLAQINVALQSLVPYPEQELLHHLVSLTLGVRLKNHDDEIIIIIILSS